MIPLSNEATLIRMAQAGDLDAFNQLVLAYQDRLFNVAVYMLYSEEGAADAVQDAFVNAYRSLDRFRGGPFFPWLMRILKNGCIDEIRRQKRYRSVPLEPVTDEDNPIEDALWLADFSGDPASICESRELSNTIAESIQRIPLEYRMALVLVDIEGMDYCNAASAVGIPLGTFKSRLARARARVSRLLGEARDVLSMPPASLAGGRYNVGWSASGSLAT